MVIKISTLIEELQSLLDQGFPDGEVSVQLGGTEIDALRSINVERGMVFLSN